MRKTMYSLRSNTSLIESTKSFINSYQKEIFVVPPIHELATG